MSEPSATKSSPRTVLIFPPVWVPIMPHLALPVLSSYLRQEGIEVRTIDANLAFFVDYLFTPEILEGLATRLRATLEAQEATRASPYGSEQIRRELHEWQSMIPELDRTLALFRTRKDFFDPDQLLKALDRVHGLMLLCSLAYWPGRISFNLYRRGDIRTLQDLVDFCSDSDENVFLPFFRERLLPEVRRLSPTLVGISISSIHQFLAAMTLARLIRRELPQVHVVTGGKHILRIQDKLLRYPFYFQEFFHSAVLHQGELPLVELSRAIASGSSLRLVPNLVFQEDGRVIANQIGPSLPLETLPGPDFGDIPWGKYLAPLRYAPVRTSEGCYWGKCTFCARYGHERPDQLSPDRVLEAMMGLTEVHGVRHFSMNDDCMPPGYWEELCGAVIKRKLDISMLIWAKPVAGFTSKRLKLMAKAGVRQIRWGVESAHPRVLRLMRKGTTLPTTRRVLLEANEAGIWNHACFIIGFPSETRQEAAATLEFIRSHHRAIHSFILYPFVLYQHSFVYGNPEEFGIRDLSVSETPFFDVISYATDRGMSPQEARRLVGESKKALMAEVYSWPFWYYLKLREYLHLYLDRYGLEGTLNIPFHRERLRGSWYAWEH